MKDSFDSVYAEHRPTVVRIAQKLTRGVGGKPILDGLVAAGMVALWQAHESYDPAQGTFWQHAYLKVFGTMVDELRVTGATSRSAAAVVRGGVVTSKQSTGLLYPVSLEEHDGRAHVGRSRRPRPSSRPRRKRRSSGEPSGSCAGRRGAWWWSTSSRTGTSPTSVPSSA